MKTKMLLGSAILMLVVNSVFATDINGGMNYDQELYRANELSMDAFGSASLGRYTIDHLSGSRIKNDARLGAGLGLSYFVTRNIGLGIDAYSENVTGVFIDNASANVIARFPLGQGGFAPYAFGGGGRQFDTVEAWLVQLGAGLEYRFTPLIGAFIDARWVLPDETKYYGVGRLGLRLAF